MVAAAVHHIEFYGDEKVLEKAAEKGLLGVTVEIEVSFSGKCSRGAKDSSSTFRRFPRTDYRDVWSPQTAD